MHLLDTELVWELRGARSGRGDPGVASWAAGQARTGLFVSALTLAELGVAATQIERTDKVGAAAIRRWAEGQVTAAFDGRVLPVETAIARRALALGYPELRNGLIAATALEHGLTLATRNPAAFRVGKVRTFNPWGYTPDAADEDIDWRQASRGGPLWLKNLFVRG
ncbi:PIN domain-containing protein [uncultured Sphingomonas sp.]|uniref:PIN domain-containing protein n=1 Tax=uncultured Sphingomonas sp. TaxID=158754 RepID=UPI0035C99A7C